MNDKMHIHVYTFGDTSLSQFNQISMMSHELDLCKRNVIHVRFISPTIFLR